MNQNRLLFIQIIYTTFQAYTISGKKLIDKIKGTNSWQSKYWNIKGTNSGQTVSLI